MIDYNWKKKCKTEECLVHLVMYLMKKKKKGFLLHCLNLFTILLGRYLALSLHNADCVSVSMFMYGYMYV